MVKIRRDKRCFNGSKLSFNTRKKAIKALDHIRDNSETNTSRYVYQCVYCRAWHMTSEEKKA